MTVKETLMGSGRFDLKFKADTPHAVLQQLEPKRSFYGQIVITAAPVNVALGESILQLARYTGIYREQPSELEIGGPGLGSVISDEDGKGPAYVTGINTPTAPVTHTFAEWYARLKPASLGAGISASPADLFGKVYPRTTLREPLDDVCAYYGVEWRVTNDFKFDLAEPDALYRSDPRAVIVRRAGDGSSDYSLKGIAGNPQLARDGDDIVRRVVLFSGDQDAPTITTSISGIANVDYPYRNVDGTSLTMDMLVEDWNVEPGQEAATVQGIFEQRRGLHEEITLDSISYDIHNDVSVGDTLFVYDPLRGIYDLANPRRHAGQTIYPQAIRCVGLTWPVRRGYGVYLRRYVKPSTTWEPQWIDLTPHVDFETGSTSLEVGSKSRVKV